MFLIDKAIINKVTKIRQPHFFILSKIAIVFSFFFVFYLIYFTFYPVFFYFFFPAIKRQIVYSTLFRDSTMSIFFNF